MPFREAQIGLRAALTARRLSVELSLLIGIVVLLAATGPFGTYALGSWAERMGYWLRTAFLGYLIYRPSLWIGGLAARGMGFSEARGWAAAVLIASGPMSLWLWWFGPAVDLSRAFPRSAELLETYLQVLLISSLAGAVVWFTGGAPDRGQVPRPREPAAAPDGAEDAAAPPPPPEIGPRLAERLPARLGREIVALQMEDHYVRVHTTKGEALVLMRMADAIGDLGGVDGCRVHRSWWAARSAVTSSRRRGRSVELVLSTGVVAPVARERVPELRALGWLT